MPSNLPVYLDYQSTTPVDDRVLAAMMPYFTERFGNAASKGHAFGWTADAATEFAREQVAGLVTGRTNEIVFTSGATEANNLAILGSVGYRVEGAHIVTVASEHKAVLDPCKFLEEKGARVTTLTPDSDGFVTADQVVNSMEEKTVLVSVMHGNNEIGTIQPVAEIGHAIKRKNASCLFHSDVAQTAGKLPIDVDEWKADLLSLSGHKIYGPKGVGALWVRRRPRIKLTPLVYGGGHEMGMRSGTLPVPLLVGFGKAAEICKEGRDQEGKRLTSLRDLLWKKLAEHDGIVVNGSLEKRLPGNLNISVDGVFGEALLLAVAPVIAVSSGAACTSSTSGPSHVLRAIGRSKDAASASLRIGLGRGTTEADVLLAAKTITETVLRLRSPG